MALPYPRCFSHIGLSLTELDAAVKFYTEVKGMAEKIVAAGGKQRMPVREYFPGEKPYRMVYMEDPFGNILEIYSHSSELTYSAGAYQSGER
ncbi:hypothetical protein [Propionivibrio limicola]|uniref:hypothetical protein n=1 Tax=Propionivibrio limicola TaxID=167645 RepID=UPI001290A91B|nr:hypothetical protein [Propionivibrio limicola]